MLKKCSINLLPYERNTFSYRGIFVSLLDFILRFFAIIKYLTKVVSDINSIDSNESSHKQQLIFSLCEVRLDLIMTRFHLTWEFKHL